MAKEIYILESNPLLSAALRDGLLEETSFEVQSFADLDRLRQACNKSQPSAILVSCPSGDPEALAFVSSGGPDASVALAMVERQDEDARQRAIAAVGPLRTATLPWQPFDLLPKLHAALERQDLILQLAEAKDELARGASALEASKKEADQTSGVLRTATARLVEAEQLAAVGRVVTGIAHEISTQLALVGYAEAIKSRVDPKSELYEFADAIVLAQRKLSTAVDQIRSFTVLEADASHFEPASLVEVVNEALAILRYDQEVRSRKVKRKDTAHPLVSLKREQFDQVVINLVSNAVQATSPGDLISIEIDEDAKAGMAILTVADAGQGMSKEVLERLGEPFFTTRGDRGSGLGIGICMSIAKAHGGSIMYVSELGVGTTAKVRLPLFRDGGPDSDLSKDPSGSSKA